MGCASSDGATDGGGGSGAASPSGGGSSGGSGGAGSGGLAGGSGGQQGATGGRTGTSTGGASGAAGGDGSGGDSGDGGSAGAPAQCDPADETPAPTPVPIDDRGAPYTGSHEVVVETDPGLPGYTLYRPGDLGGEDDYPIVAWGQGGCSLNGTTHPEFLAEIASHGYLVIADGAPNGSGSRPMISDYQALGAPLIQALDWAIAENDRPCSQYYRSLEPSKLAVMGWSCGGLMAEGVSSDPRLTTVLINNSGLLAPSDSIYDGIHTPMLILCGGPEDIAYPNGQRDYAAIDDVPIAFINAPVGHGGTFFEDNGGDFARVDLAWLQWWLKGDLGATGKGMFVGENCGLCGDARWTLESKNLD